MTVNYSAAEWTAPPTEITPLSAVVTGDVVYLGYGLAPVRVGAVDPQPDG